jgi:hypothetical protein
MPSDKMLPADFGGSHAPPLIGYCGITSSSMGNCERGNMGSWQGLDHSACIQRCQRCTRCNFISVSHVEKDCSWYTACGLPLQIWHGGETFRTVKVKPASQFVNSSYVQEWASPTPAQRARRARRHEHASHACQRPKDLLARSYLLPRRYPFPPTRLIMETQPRSCDFYERRDFCNLVEADVWAYEEDHVASAGFKHGPCQ